MLIIFVTDSRSSVRSFIPYQEQGDEEQQQPQQLTHQEQQNKLNEAEHLDLYTLQNELYQAQTQPGGPSVVRKIENELSKTILLW